MKTLTPTDTLFIGAFCGLVVGYAAGTLMWFEPRRIQASSAVTATVADHAEASSCTCQGNGQTWPCLVRADSPFFCDHGSYGEWVARGRPDQTR